MTPDQMKRRDDKFEEYQKRDHNACNVSFKAGYEAGFEDSEINKAVCCMEMEEQNAELTRKLAWLINHAWMCSAISKAKAAELLGCSLIDFDDKISAAIKGFK